MPLLGLQLIFTESTLFLGLGDTSVPSWGQTLSEGYVTSAWHLILHRDCTSLPCHCSISWVTVCEMPSIQKHANKGVMMSEESKTHDQPAVVLELKNLQTHFFTDMGVARSVDGVSYKVKEGQTLELLGNLVAESQ